MPDTPHVSDVDVRAAVDDALRWFLAEQATTLHEVGPELDEVAAVVSSFVLSGGKRLRPAFCYWGWRGSGSTAGSEVVTAAASLELLHAGALVHDDVIDRSDIRRGRPAVHRRFATVHRTEGWQGDPDAFGAAAAVLVGDLCLIWADQLYARSGLPADALYRGHEVYDAMRVEVMSGQYLDVIEQAVGGGSVERALRVARYKTAKYTVERPLQLGGALAGAGPELAAVYSRYGLPLGEAFQLRDDVLGAFGDPAVTGKPAGDDLRQGKRTALVATALAGATPDQSRLIRRHLGDQLLDEAGVAELQAVIRATGALEQVERLIATRTAQSLAALSDPALDPAAADALSQLADAATVRLG
jgi:geranylgeranyl diphosphate synthase type I